MKYCRVYFVGMKCSSEGFVGYRSLQDNLLGLLGVSVLMVGIYDVKHTEERVMVITAIPPTWPLTQLPEAPTEP